MGDLYTIDGDILTGIADAIRAKLDVTTGIKPEDMALGISLIQAGSGGGSDGIKTGTVNISANVVNTTNTVTISHGLGKKPSWILIRVDLKGAIPSSTSQYYVKGGMADVDGSWAAVVRINSSSTISASSSSTQTNPIVDTISATSFRVRTNASSAIIPSGSVLTWVAL